MSPGLLNPSVLLLPVLLPACVCSARVTVVAVVIVTCDVFCLSLRRVRWMFRTRRFVGCYLRCHLGCWTLVPSVVTCVVTCVCVLWACYRRGCGDRYLFDVACLSLRRRRRSLPHSKALLPPYFEGLSFLLRWWWCSWASV